MHLQDPLQYEDPDKDFIIVALDLISGIVQGLGPLAEPLIDATLLQCVLISMKDPINEVRQSAFALLGDFAINVFPAIKPHLSTFMAEVLTQVTPRCEAPLTSVCNNAIWSAGEIALKCGAEMQPFVNPMLERLIPLLNEEMTTRTLKENAAISIGRLGFACPDVVAPHLEIFVTEFCRSLGSIKDNGEKESAFIGLCKMIEKNPNGMLKVSLFSSRRSVLTWQSFVYFCGAITGWHRISPELNEYFKRVRIHCWV